jgi:hypothetical protein
MALSSTPLTTVVLDTVAPAEVGIASGVNSTFARVASLLAVSLVGALTVTLFARAIAGHVAFASLPPSLRHNLAVTRPNFTDMNIPEAVQGPDRMVLDRILSEAFVASFRSVAGLSAGVALATALATARTVHRRATAKEPDGQTVVACTHLDQILEAKPSSAGCEECLRVGDHWIHLRLCLSCGHVGCCDSSKNRHATLHFWATSHPIVRSLQPGENWSWCYVDEVVV